MKYACFCLFLLLSRLVPAQEEPMTLRTFSGNIEGTLLLPEKKEGIPLVLIIAGSGPTDRNGNVGDMENNSLKMLAAELAKSNIASLRYDKRGVAGSADAMEDEGSLRFDTYVDDAKAWINQLAFDKRFSKIIVAGHSEGSLLGMIAASGSKRVSGFISIAGAGRPADVLIKEQLNKVPDEIKNILFPMLDRVKKGDTITNVPPIYYMLLRPSLQPYMTSWFKYDPQKEIKKLKMPVLILQGGTDIQVKESDAQLLYKAQPKATLKIIPTMNHVLKDCSSTDKKEQEKIYSDPALPLNTELTASITAFILGLPAKH